MKVAKIITGVIVVLVVALVVGLVFKFPAFIIGAGIEYEVAGFLFLFGAVITVIQDYFFRVHRFDLFSFTFL